MNRLRASLFALLPFAATACGDMRPTAPGQTGGKTVISTPTASTALLGSWSFTRFFYDDAGNLHSSQTVWTFMNGGSVTRTVYSDNLTAGIGDAITTIGTWTATSSAIDVTFPGSTTPTRYSYYFEGTALVLAGTAFIRLGA